MSQGPWVETLEVTLAYKRFWTAVKGSHNSSPNILNKIEPVNPFYLENKIKNYPQDFGILVGLVLLFVV